MREDYRDYIPEGEFIIRETSQALEDLHDDILTNELPQNESIDNNENN